MKSLLHISTFLILLSTGLYAQPANDVCSGATTLPQDGTCVAGTTVGANDNWVGSVGCAGNNVNEVWYSFVASGTNATISVAAGTMGGNVQLVLVEASGACTGLTIRGSNCSAGNPQVSTVTGLQVGVLYYITINPSGADGTFSICNTVSTPPPVPGQDCTNPAPLCDNSSFSQGVFAGVGVAENIATNTCFGGNERQAKWYSFTCSASGTFEFYIDPNAYNSASQTGDDFDFALWNTTSSCYSSGTTMGAAMACNWSGCSGSTGVSPTLMGQTAVTDYQANNPPGPGDCFGNQQWQTTAVNLVAGEKYTLLIDNFSSSGGGFTVNFGGTAVIGPDATFAADLDLTCMTVSVDRAPFYTGPNMTYQWNFGDGFTSTAATPADHTYASIGMYTVSLQVTDANGCTETFSRQVDVGCILLSIQLVTFKGEHKEKHNLIEWTAKSESDIDYYVVQRSINGINWSEAGVVAAGTSIEEDQYNNYTFQDYNYFPSEYNYYRLKLVNFDGVASYSHNIAIETQNAIKTKNVYKVVNQLGQTVKLSDPCLKIVVYTDGTSTMIVGPAKLK